MREEETATKSGPHQGANPVGEQPVWRTKEHSGTQAPQSEPNKEVAKTKSQSGMLGDSNLVKSEKGGHKLTQHPGSLPKTPQSQQTEEAMLPS